MVTVDKHFKEICRELNCANYRFPYTDEAAEFCTIHNPERQCRIAGCKKFKTNIKTNTDLEGTLCYIHTSQEVIKTLIKNNVHGYGHLDITKYSQVSYIPTKPSALDKAKEQLLHGTRMMYKTGCRCTPCKEANAKYEQKRRQRHELRLHHLPIPQELDRELRWLYAGTQLELWPAESEEDESISPGPDGRGTDRGHSGMLGPGDFDLPDW